MGQHPTIDILEERFARCEINSNEAEGMDPNNAVIKATV